MTKPQQFTDFEPYCDTIAHADLRMRVLGMEEARYSIIQATVGQLAIQWAQEGSGQLSEGAIDRSAFGLYMQLNSRPRLLNGMPLDPDAIVVLPPGSEFCFSCDHANSWIAIRVPTELLTVPGGDDQRMLLNYVSVVRTGKELARNLREKVLAYLQTVQHTPWLPSSKPVTSRLEHQILAIARKLCFRSRSDRSHSEETMTLLEQRHGQIALAAASAIEDSLDVTVSVAAIAKSLGVSERTLLTAFRSRFELPPRQFIQSIRLNRARAKLREASYPETLVKHVAAECGFWDFGRFAAKYQQLFGELPTQTVKKCRSSR